MLFLSRRRFLRLLCGSLLLVSVAAEALPAEESRAPNLLFVLVDQMRAHAMGFMKQDPVITPNLDRFAAESLVLTQAVSNYPVCSPYRAMWMTGQYPHTNGVLSNCNSNGARYGYELQRSARCWSDVLRERGYRLGYLGKWHLDSPRRPYVESYNNSEKFAWNEWCPPERRHGFDFWYAYGTFDRHLTPEYWSTDMTRDERVKVEQWGPEHETDLAIRYLRNEGGAFRREGEPFALVVSMNPPHTPYPLVPERYVAQYEERTTRELINRANVDFEGNTPAAREARRQIRNYFAMVTGIDDQFGRLLAALEKSGLDEQTIVVFTSDHGNCIGSHNHSTKNVHYEESMRVPFLIRWPGKIPARRDGLLLSTPDIYPTLLDLMGHGDAIPEEVQGVSHARIFRGGDGPRPESQLYLFVPYGHPAYGRRGVRTERYTMVIEEPPGKPRKVYLHDNVADAYQLKNIAAEKPEVVERLRKEHLVPWLRKTGDPWLERQE